MAKKNSEPKARVFDDAERRKLAGMMPFKKGASVWVRLPEFEFLGDEQPEFEVSVFDEETCEAVRKAASEADADVKSWDAAMFEAVKKSLRGWKGMVDLATWEQLPYSSENVELLRGLPIVSRLYTRIAEFSGLLEVDREGLGY